MTPEQIVNKFEKAVANHAFKGAMDPEDRPRIQKEYEQSKKKLLKYILNLKSELAIIKARKQSIQIKRTEKVGFNS